VGTGEKDYDAILLVMAIAFCLPAMVIALQDAIGNKPEIVMFTASVTAPADSSVPRHRSSCESFALAWVML
jgi:hypothetical protein